MRIFAICAVFSCSMLLAAGERATLNIFTSPDNADVFLDDNPEKEISGSPFENPAMLTGEHTVFLVPASESFVPATYNFILHNGRVFEINHDFLRRNQVREAYSLSPSQYHIEANAGFLYFNEFDSNSTYKMPFDFRLGLPWGFGARLAFPVQEWEIKNFLLGMQYNYFPLQIGITLDWINPRGSGFSAIRAAILAEQNALFLNLLENLVYEYSKQEKAEFYLRFGMPVKHIFLPYLVVREKIHLPLKSYMFYTEPGALLQVNNGFSLEASIPLAIIGKNVKRGFGFYFGLHLDFSFGRESKKDVHKASSIIWDVNEVSNREYKKFCEETGCEIPIRAKVKELEDYPVLHISLKNAIAYSKWAKKRLPTAEEWKTLASAYSSSNLDSLCETRKLKKVYEGYIVNGVRNFAGNAAIWLLPENESASVASFAGSSYEDSPETCKKKAALTDISSSDGNDFIGIRLVKDY
jgi:hypothetical protein